jgi:hypothetical protein
VVLSGFTRAAEPLEQNYYPVISRIERCAIKPDATIDFVIQCSNGRSEKMAEEALQEVRPYIIYNYWALRHGRGEATALDTFHVFRILNRRVRGAVEQFKCQ